MTLVLVHNTRGPDVVHDPTCPHIVYRGEVGSPVPDIPILAVACGTCRARPYDPPRYVPLTPRPYRPKPVVKEQRPRQCALIDGVLTPTSCPDCGSEWPPRRGSQWSCECGWRGQPSGRWERVDHQGHDEPVVHTHDAARARAAEPVIGKLGGFDAALAPRRRGTVRP